MAQIETTIENLLKTLLLIKKPDRERIAKLLKTANESEKEQVLAFLKKKKKEEAEIIQEYLKTKGKDGMSALEKILTRGKSRKTKKEEQIDRKTEDQAAENLLKELDKI